MHTRALRCNQHALAIHRVLYRTVPNEKHKDHETFFVTYLQHAFAPRNHRRMRQTVTFSRNASEENGRFSH